MLMDLNVLREVYDIIEDRKIHPKSKSYVTTLLLKGAPQIISKIEEESKELLESLDTEQRSDILHEAVDLIFHTFILLAYKNITLNEILHEFRRRRK